MIFVEHEHIVVLEHHHVRTTTNVWAKEVEITVTQTQRVATHRAHLRVRVIEDIAVMV